MNKNLIIKKLAEHFSIDALKTAVQNLSPTPQNNEGLALMDAALQIANDKENIWFTVFAALSVHDTNLAARLLQTATNVQGKLAISGLSQTLFLQMSALSCKLTKADAGRNLDGTIEHTLTKAEVIAQLNTFFIFPYLQNAVNMLNARTPKDEGIDILWAAVQLDPAVDPLQIWFDALAVICVHNRPLAAAVLTDACYAAGHDPVAMGMNKAELIDAIASGSKLTKADAG